MLRHWVRAVLTSLGPVGSNQTPSLRSCAFKPRTSWDQSEHLKNMSNPSICEGQADVRLQGSCMWTWSGGQDASSWAFWSVGDWENDFLAPKCPHLPNGGSTELLTRWLAGSETQEPKVPCAVPEVQEVPAQR